MAVPVREKGRARNPAFRERKKPSYFFSSFFFSSFFISSFFSSFFFSSFLASDFFSSFFSCAKATGVTVTAAKMAANSVASSLLMGFPLGELNIVSDSDRFLLSQLLTLDAERWLTHGRNVAAAKVRRQSDKLRGIRVLPVSCGGMSQDPPGGGA